jgi:hypothetical protein
MKQNPNTDSARALPESADWYRWMEEGEPYYGRYLRRERGMVILATPWGQTDEAELFPEDITQVSAAEVIAAKGPIPTPDRS